MTEAAMADNEDDRIRRRAYRIWEEEGRPEGREYSHWLRARQEERASGLPDDMSRADAAEIAKNTVPPGTVPDNPTRAAALPTSAAAVDGLRPKASAAAGKTGTKAPPLDERDIDTQLDEPNA
ncbi:DUF2934 domain-containing protein [Rhizobium sp. TRM95111]|uniref:DUF2934 domain-containing protein n=1 Tax=Rhizobium alarense TaxID=2846851 RepID=UPI001F364B5C|nr:DUF2934 domain-containing protein [Rhizobium alarense]MCF3643164.1 DUF2934 domain-containing protein [Rhizobium alarense]